MGLKINVLIERSTLGETDNTSLTALLVVI